LNQLGEVEVTFGERSKPDRLAVVGALLNADVVTGARRLATPEESYSGGIKPGGPSLKGLKLGNNYRFSCVEEIEESEATGRERRALYLIEHRPA